MPQTNITRTGQIEHQMPMGFNPTMQACINACNICVQACDECYSACLGEPDVQARIHCVQVLRDCADSCAMAVQYMSRNSEFSQQICGICATICDTCAAECAKFQDAHCQKCADICRSCADECRKMTTVM